MYVSFCRFSGPYEYDDRQATKASTVIEVGDVLEEDTGLAPAESNDSVAGIALQARASVANQTPILIMRLFAGRTKIYGEAEAGTFVQASDSNRAVDLNSADGLAADTYTNGDFLVYHVLSTTQAVGAFVKLLNVS